MSTHGLKSQITELSENIKNLTNEKFLEHGLFDEFEKLGKLVSTILDANRPESEAAFKGVWSDSQVENDENEVEVVDENEGDGEVAVEGEGEGEVAVEVDENEGFIPTNKKNKKKNKKNSSKRFNESQMAYSNVIDNRKDYGQRSYPPNWVWKVIINGEYTPNPTYDSAITHPYKIELELKYLSEMDPICENAEYFNDMNLKFYNQTIRKKKIFNYYKKNSIFGEQTCFVCSDSKLYWLNKDNDLIPVDIHGVVQTWVEASSK